VFLTEFRVGNFKAFGETQRLPIRPITLIYGPNSGGKSSLIHGLLLAHEAIVNKKLDVHQTQIGGDTVDLGGFANYVHRHEEIREVEFGFRLPKPALGDVSGQLADSEWNVTSKVAYSHKPYVKSCCIHGERGRMLLTETSGKLSLTEIGGEPLGSFRVYDTRELALGEMPAFDVERDDVQSPGDFTYDEWRQIREVEAIGAGLVPERLERKLEDEAPQLRGWRSKDDRKRMAAPWLDGEKLPGYLSYEEWARRNDVTEYKEPAEDDLPRDATLPEWDKYDAFIKRLRAPSLKNNAMRAVPFKELNGIVEAVHERLRKGFGELRYLGPFRSYPPRQVPPLSAVDPNAHATGASAFEVAGTKDDVRDTVNQWLNSELLPTPYKLEADLSLTDTHRKVRVSHRDIGVGISQVLPVLVEAYRSRGATIVIEQPEIHLHPALQAALGDVFIKAALNEHPNTFIIETHSEHLILRLLRRIRETAEDNIESGMTAIKPEDVSVVYVEPTESGSRVLVMDLDEKGRLASPWPGGFFTERADELF
jgi:hypothetical protein